MTIIIWNDSYFEKVVLFKDSHRPNTQNLYLIANTGALVSVIYEITEFIHSLFMKLQSFQTTKNPDSYRP